MLLDDVSVSRDRIEISENTRAKGTTFSLFGSLTNVKYLSVGNYPLCNS